MNKNIANLVLAASALISSSCANINKNLVPMESENNLYNWEVPAHIAAQNDYQKALEYQYAVKEAFLMMSEYFPKTFEEMLDVNNDQVISLNEQEQFFQQYVK